MHDFKAHIAKDFTRCDGQTFNLLLSSHLFLSENANNVVYNVSMNVLIRKDRYIVTQHVNKKLFCKTNV